MHKICIMDIRRTVPSHVQYHSYGIKALPEIQNEGHAAVYSPYKRGP